MDTLAGPIISPGQREEFLQKGFLIVPNAINADLAAQLARAAYDFVGALPTEPETWYTGTPRLNGSVNMFGHAAQWKLRQSPTMYRAFAELYQKRELWVSIDRLKLTPPISADHPEWHHEPFIHWDIDTRSPITDLVLQGLVALADTSWDQGGFQCVEGFPPLFDKWRARQPIDRDPFRPDMRDLMVSQVPMTAGDLLIWSALLPHGNGQNRSTKPRLAQFVRYYPCSPDPAVRMRRLSLWREQSVSSQILLSRPTLGANLSVLRIGKMITLNAVYTILINDAVQSSDYVVGTEKPSTPCN